MLIPTEDRKDIRIGKIGIGNRNWKNHGLFSLSDLNMCPFRWLIPVILVEISLCMRIILFEKIFSVLSLFNYFT